MKYRDNMTSEEIKQLLFECNELDKSYADADARHKAYERELEDALRRELLNAGWNEDQIKEELAMLRDEEWAEKWD